MTIPCKPEVGLIIEANALYVLNMKSQGSITWSDLTGKTRVSAISWWLKYTTRMPKILHKVPDWQPYMNLIPMLLQQNPQILFMA